MYDSERRASNYFPATCKYMYIQYFSIHCQIKYQKNKLLFRDREPEKLWKRVLKGLFTSNFAKFLLPIFDEPKKL